MRLTLPFVTLCVPGSALQPQWAGESGLLVGLWASGGLTGSGRSAVMSRTHGSNVLLTRQLAPPRANHVRTRGRAELCFCDSASEITAACFQHSRFGLRGAAGSLVPPGVLSLSSEAGPAPESWGACLTQSQLCAPSPESTRAPLPPARSAGASATGSPEFGSQLPAWFSATRGVQGSSQNKQPRNVSFGLHRWK